MAVKWVYGNWCESREGKEGPVCKGPEGHDKRYGFSFVGASFTCRDERLGGGDIKSILKNSVSKHELSTVVPKLCHSLHITDFSLPPVVETWELSLLLLYSPYLAASSSQLCLLHTIHMLTMSMSTSTPAITPD